MDDFNPRIACIVGQIASGKTTLARYLEQCGFERVREYTTRPIRHPDENSDLHFVAEEEFDAKARNGFFAATVEFDAVFGHCAYGVALHDICSSKLERKVLVTNPAVVMTLKDAGYRVFVVHLDFDQETVMRRALARGDTPAEIGRRVSSDEIKFGLLHTGGYVDLTVTDTTLRPYEIATLIRDCT